MDSFKEFNGRLAAHLSRLLEEEDHLFVVDVGGDELWDMYLESFTPGNNEIYRERREHDCSCCKAFIRQFGAVVSIVDNQVVSIWGFDAGSDKFQPVVNELDTLVRSRPVVNVFVTKQAGYGTDHSNELLDDGNVRQWNHFRVVLPAKVVTRSGDTEGSIAAALRSSKEVLQRSLSEISQDACEMVLDLISENSLYKGAEWVGPLKVFRKMQDEYRVVDSKDLYCWTKSLEVGAALSHIRNHSIGTLLQDLTEGMDVIDAVKRYERIVAPENYKRPKQIFTKRMVENAQAKVAELGLTDSLSRRFARLTDVTVNNVLFADRDAVQVMTSGGVFEQLLQEATHSPQGIPVARSIGIEEFLSQVLPTMTSMEVLLENQLATRMVSLVAPAHPEAPSLFKWNNGFSWAYAGNLTDSTMRRRVKAAGGKVDGALRFSIQWNESGKNHNDFDAHCREPGGRLISYRRMRGRTGELDVDIIHPTATQVAVENIITTTPLDGVYVFGVHNYSQRDGRDGFRAELEFGGKLYEFDYPERIAHNKFVQVARLRFAGGKFELLESLTHSASSRQVWGLNTQQFHRVSLVTYSPNYWDAQSGVGHRHVFFMLAEAQNDEKPNGFYNEFLKEEFMEQKRVFAALGSKMRVQNDPEQLSGVGFSTTRRGAVIVRVDGSSVYKVVF